jgi:AraC family transcriptional regulator
VSVVLAGSLAETARGERREARAGGVVFKPAGERHSDEFGPRGATLLRIVLAEGADLPRYRWIEGGGVESAIGLRVALALSHGDDAGRLDAEGLVAALLRRAADGPARADAGGSARPPWLGPVIAALRERALSPGPLHAADLAPLASVHPVHLARVFRKHAGCSIGEYARRLRLDRAAERLETEGDAPIARVAIDAGFSDQAHFTRAFRARVGVPPARFRRMRAQRRFIFTTGGTGCGGCSGSFGPRPLSDTDTG